jgi:ABC-type nitrate/sulfonate/bicarbonate transport system permease component
MRTYKSTLILICLAVALLLVAQVLFPIVGIPSYFLPRPSEIISSMHKNFVTMVTALAITSGEAGGGLMLAVVLSFPLAVATLMLPRAALKVVTGIGVAFQSMPLLAIAPLLTLWFGHTYFSKAVAAMIVCFFPLLTGWLSGFASISAEQLQLFENMHATKLQTARFLYVPLSLPFFFGGLQVAMPLALLGAIVAEFIGASKGLGFQILQNSYYLKTADMFAYIIIATVTGWLLTLLVAGIERKVLFWRSSPERT